MFSAYCERKFEVEPVKVIYPDGKSHICPDLSVYEMDVSLSYINNVVGASLAENQVLCFKTLISTSFCYNLWICFSTRLPIVRTN